MAVVNHGIKIDAFTAQQRDSSFAQNSAIAAQINSIRLIDKRNIRLCGKSARRSGNRTAAGPTVPPGGLYMTHLWYDDGVEDFECTPERPIV